MSFVLQVIFWFCVYSIFHSYILYPIFLKLISKSKTANSKLFSKKDQLPFVSVLIAAHNEEKVIGDKVLNVLQSEYPQNRFRVYIGSDNSTDKTNTICETLVNAHEEHLRFRAFSERQGKPQIVNLLAETAIQHAGLDDHVFIITDANVMLDKQAVWHMVKHFSNSEIGLVDSRMINIGLKSEGISKSEDTYISNEIRIKQWEGNWARVMMGPFGGCYAVRANSFTPIPPHFLVDDFYVSMRVLEKGEGAINEIEAKSYEAISHDLNAEFKRKVRIAAGNFQNLGVFKKMLWPFWRPLGFAFLSHKVLRWLGIFFMLIAFISSGILALSGNIFFQVLFLLQTSIYVAVPLVDKILNGFNIHFKYLRGLNYFIMMNIAFLFGFIKYCKGVKSGIWQPTERVIK